MVVSCRSAWNLIFPTSRTSLGNNDRWNPKAGDIIVSNWSSWIELLYLAFKYIVIPETFDTQMLRFGHVQI
jgi:hypothetical protein